jgi:hypothetical protein
MMPNWYAKAVGLEFGLIPETGKHRDKDTYSENQIEELIDLLIEDHLANANLVGPQEVDQVATQLRLKERGD